MINSIPAQSRAGMTDNLIGLTLKAQAKKLRRTMTRKTAKDFEPEVLKLFDSYVRPLSRRGFLASAQNSLYRPDCRRFA